MSVDTELFNEAQDAAFFLLVKLHNETACGEGGDHWSECERMVAACGYKDWDTFLKMENAYGVTW